MVISPFPPLLPHTHSSGQAENQSLVTATVQQLQTLRRRERREASSRELEECLQRVHRLIGLDLGLKLLLVIQMNDS